MEVLKKYLKVIIIVLLILIPILTLLPAHADSGWDSSYSSSSSYDSDGVEAILELIIYAIIHPIQTLIIILIIGLICLINEKLTKLSKNRRIKHNPELAKAISISDYCGNSNAIIPYSLLEKELLYTIKKLQTAYTNFDYNTLKNYTSKSIYHTYSKKLKKLYSHNEQNIIDDIALNACRLKGIYDINRNIVIVVELYIECFNYIIDKDKKIIKGNNQLKAIYHYELTLTKGPGIINDCCPGCGAPIDSNNKRFCRNCKSLIIDNQNEFIISKAKKLKK